MKYLVLALIIGSYVSCTTTKNQVTGVFTGKPKINNPTVTGNYPNAPFLFAVPTSGERPISWTAEGLPPGLQIDSTTGFISGQVNQKGDYKVLITAKNKLGADSRELTIRIDDTLALTPPMGWNSWNTFRGNISDSLIRETADYMVSSGMRDLGYQYLNIDDLWQLLERDSSGNIQVNPAKFPHGMKAVVKYVHSKGLKFGIYSDAADTTCGGVAGSYLHEVEDAKTFASWGVDLLKYDYCGAPYLKDSAIARYSRMAKALRNTNRSIVFSVCEWGAFGSEPWTWADSIGGNYWRTTQDIRNSWFLRNDPDQCGIMDILRVNAHLSNYAGPGHWNDPDMLVIGINGKDRDAVVNVNQNQGRPLTEVEQQSQMSLWCLMAAPLLCGNDIRSMNTATKKILLNPEIIAINQDPLGKQANVIYEDSVKEIFEKPLRGGSVAIGMLNLSEKPVPISVSWSQLHISGNWEVSNVWTHEDIGLKNNFIESKVLPHECKVFELTKTQKE